MANEKLAQIIDDAFEERDTVTPKTKGAGARGGGPGAEPAR